MTKTANNSLQPAGSRADARLPVGEFRRWGISMRTLLTLVFLFGITLFGKAAGVPSGSQKSPVWYWQAGGNGQRMKLEVRLDNKTIFTTTFSAAHAGRSAIPKRSYGLVVITSPGTEKKSNKGLHATAGEPGNGTAAWRQKAVLSSASTMTAASRELRR